MLQTYGDYEKQQQAIIREANKRDTECITCPKCSSQWFEEVQCNRYKINHHLVVGQHVPPKPGTIPFILLRCLLCNDVLEPQVVANTRDLAGHDYDHFLDTVEGKLDTRGSEEEDGVKKNEISSEKL